MKDYLFLKQHSLDDWRKLTQTSHKAHFERLLNNADSYHDYLPPDEHPSDSITYIGTAVLNLALSYLLTEDAKYLNTARRWIEVAINYPHWGKERMPDHDLDAAWLLFGLSLGYDWLKNTLPDDERRALRDKLALQSHLLYEFAVENEGSWWSSAYWQNHNWICYGGLAFAAYALWEHTEETRLWADRARDNFKQALSLMPEDGSDYEGPVYWRYGFIWFLVYADLLQQQTGESLHESGFLQNTFFYRLYLSGPNLVDAANWGDCHDRRSAHTAAVYARLAGLYNIGEAQWLLHHFYETGEWEREGREGLVKPGLWAESGLEFLWYEPQVTAQPISNLPLTRVFPDLGLVAARSSWNADGVTMTYKCGAPNGLKAWHSGQSLNHKFGWNTISAGHNHPDENSFIVISGNDYLIVDEGYSRDKLTRNHSSLLVDGHGQYDEGGYNVFHGLTETWGGRLEDSFVFESLVYARGEASRAYPTDMKLRQFSRQMLFLDGSAIILHDTICSDLEHDYQWLLQTDSPAEQLDARSFSITTGETAFKVHALQPSDVTYQIDEQEITANPTSAKPDWIIRRTQYALSLSPSETIADTHYFVVLNLDGYQVASQLAQRGNIAHLTGNDNEWRIGFATGRDGILSDTLNIDGKWFAGQWQKNKLTNYIAGDVTSLWLDSELYFMADLPVNAGWRKQGVASHLTIDAAKPTWIRFRSAQPNSLTRNNAAVDYHYDALTAMVWIKVPAGTSEIRMVERASS